MGSLQLIAAPSLSKFNRLVDDAVNVILANPV